MFIPSVNEPTGTKKLQARCETGRNVLLGIGSGTFTNQSGLAFPANNQALVYDADGNLTFDGVWNYQWNGENRLISMNMTNVANIANANRLRLDFAYDFMGRRMQKVVSTWNGSAFANPVTNLFVYDGWNLLAILSPSFQLQSSYTWGNDLSGTMTRAGGVGGLLMANLSGTNCFTAFDGNGNITALINAADKSVAARYEYSPFHELLRATGPAAHLNPFRSSTKYWDDESGLVFYGGRFYSPALGKWISRDPSGERDNKNVYGFVRNNPIGRLDTNGKTSIEDIIEGILEYNYANGMPMADAIDAFRKERITGEVEALSGTLVDTIGGWLSDKVADIYVNPAIILDKDIGFQMVASDIQEFEFDRNLQNILTGRLQSQTANNDLIGMVVGIAAAAANANGGNGYDLILDASMSAAGTMGVDSAETIWGVAMDIGDQ